MATFQLQIPEGRFTNGTVHAYAASNWGRHQLPPSGAPLGSSATSATASGGTVSFTGLSADTRYYAYQEVGGQHRYLPFSTHSNVPPAQQTGRTTLVEQGNVSGTTPVDLTGKQESVVTATATGTTTLSFAGLQAGSSWTLVLKQDATGDRAVSFSGVTWPAGSPQLSRLANAVNVVSFFSPDGSTVYGFPATTAANPSVPYPGYDAARLEAFPRMWARDAVQWASGSILLAPFVAERDFTASNLVSATRGTAAATVTTAKMGLYSVSGTTHTCIARTANDTNLWSAAATTYSRAIVDAGPSGGAISSVQLYAGKTYSFAAFAVATTMPQWSGLQLATTGTAGLPALSPALALGFGGQTDLIQTLGSPGGAIAMPWGAMT